MNKNTYLFEFYKISESVVPDFGNYRYLYFDLDSIFTFSSTVFAMFLCSAHILFLFHSPTFYSPSTKLWEGNVFSRVCLLVILFKGGGCPCTGLCPALTLDMFKLVPGTSLYRDSPTLDMFNPVQLGPHHTVPPPPPHPTCSNLFAMKHEQSAGGRLAFD